MAVSDVLDREVIVDRAEAVRFWLLSFTLSQRAAGAIQRELGAIIDDLPGPSGGGPHPLAGLTVADFIAELHSPQGGAVGRVKSVGDAALRELRAAIRPGARRAPSDLELPDLEPPDLEPPAPEPAAEAAQAEAQSGPRRRGRPRGAARAKSDGPELSAAGSLADAQRRRGRPRKAAAPALPAAPAQPEASSAAPAPPSGGAAPQLGQGDQSLDDLMRQWPGLHPHARRAVVLYASTLLAEAAYGG